MYTQEQYQFIKNECREIMIFYGYMKDEMNPEGIFEYSDLTTDEIANKNSFNKYNKLHKQALVENKQNGIKTPFYHFDTSICERI